MPAGFDILYPAQQTSPVVISSPHSGRNYPAAFLAQSVLTLPAIRSSEDAFVDSLVAAGPDLGAPLLRAHVPRAYIDLNRAPDEFDPALIEDVRRVDNNPRVASGLGVVPRVVAGGRAIYRGKIPMSEAEQRVQDYWYPYHQALRQLLNATVQRFGCAILLDMHSMPSEAAQMMRPAPTGADVVLGDRHGASAHSTITAQIERAFRGQDLQVARNSPFAGAYIAQHYGRPTAGVHVVQIEISRGLYMDEGGIAPLAHFTAFQARITAALAQIISAHSASSALAAE